MTTERPPKDDWELRLQTQLARAADSLGTDTQRRLRLARHRALDALAAPRRRNWVPAAAALASVALLATVAVLRGNERPLAPTTAQPIMADLDVLADEDDLELLEDLEFYAWLAGQDDLT